MVPITFTGTLEGMSQRQKKAFKYLITFLISRQDIVLIHGDCIGADQDADYIAAEFKVEREVFPCDIPSKRAYCNAETIHPRQRPLDRNRQMVQRAELIIAAPKRLIEEQRSGTWATIRYARKEGKSIIILYP